MNDSKLASGGYVTGEPPTMTNADYYVNVYADGVLGWRGWKNRKDCDYEPLEPCPIARIGVWHVRLKKDGGSGDR